MMIDIVHINSLPVYSNNYVTAIKTHRTQAIFFSYPKEKILNSSDFFNKATSCIINCGNGWAYRHIALMEARKQWR